MSIPSASLTVELRGGLANQLFQWATFATIWDSSRGPLAWDERIVTRPGHPGNELLRVGLIPNDDVVRQSRSEGLLWSFMERMPKRLRVYAAATLAVRAPLDAQRVLNEGEAPLAYQDDRWWTRGYFQDPSLFESSRDDIRKTLRGALEAAVPTQNWRLNYPYSAIHVRRGDYVSIQKIAQRLGVCTLDYFCAAAGDLDGALPIKIVSDDPEWCRSVLRPSIGGDVEVVETKSDIADLLILAGSSEIVLSNSTFSWWGAFASSARRVVAPDRFFDAPDAGGDRLPHIADILREKETGRLAVPAD